MMKKTPGFTSGMVMGTLFFVVGLAALILAPEFSGFLDRVETDSRMPIWALLLGFALVNYVYALVSQFLGRKQAETQSSTHAEQEKTVAIPEEEQDN